MKTQVVTGLDPGSWYAVYPPIKCEHCEIVNDTTLFLKAGASDPSITLLGGTGKVLSSKFLPTLVAFYLKPSSGSPEPGLIWS